MNRGTSLLVGIGAVALAVALSLRVFGAEVPLAVRVDFTRGVIPPEVVAEQAGGKLSVYSARCYVTGDWFLPWELEAGDRVEVDINTRYPSAEGILLGKKRIPISRYTYGEAIPYTVKISRSTDSLVLEVPPTIVSASPDARVGFYGPGTNLSNCIQLLRARFYEVPDPTPTPSPTATETPSATPTETATETSTPSPIATEIASPTPASATAEIDSASRSTWRVIVEDQSRDVSIEVRIKYPGGDWTVLSSDPEAAK